MNVIKAMMLVVSISTLVGCAGGDDKSSSTKKIDTQPEAIVDSEESNEELEAILALKCVLVPECENICFQAFPYKTPQQVDQAAASGGYIQTPMHIEQIQREHANFSRFAACTEYTVGEVLEVLGENPTSMHHLYTQP